MGIIAANFKSYLTRKSVLDYASALDSYIKSNKITNEILIFPPASALLENRFSFLIGAQNAYCARNGAFTGEISLEHLNEFDIKTILLGHSERRIIFSESDELIAQKFRFFAQLNFKIVLCIGEDLATRKAGKLSEVLEKQLDSIDVDYKNLCIAYEPIWAIGSGVSARLEEIISTHEKLRALTKRPLLYGGSVKLENAKDILALDNVDGLLIGSASLDLTTFKEILRTCENIK